MNKKDKTKNQTNTYEEETGVSGVMFDEFITTNQAVNKTIVDNFIPYPRQLFQTKP